jgi:hypothetical protein
MGAFERFSNTIDEISANLTKAPAPQSQQSRLFRLRHSWTHRRQDSFLELWVGAQLLVRCKLSAGHLMLGSISLGPSRELPRQWQLAQQNADTIFAGPNAEAKLKSFVLGLIQHEFLIVLKQALQASAGKKRLKIQTDVSLGTLIWSDLIDSEKQFKVQVTVEECIKVHFQGAELFALSLGELVNQLRSHEQGPPATPNRVS